MVHESLASVGGIGHGQCASVCGLCTFSAGRTAHRAAGVGGLGRNVTRCVTLVCHDGDREMVKDATLDAIKAVAPMVGPVPSAARRGIESFYKDNLHAEPSL